MKERLERWQATRPWRAWSRYGERRGNVLAAGMAYISFFSLFPALALGFAALGLILGRRTDLQLTLVGEINGLVGSTVIGLRAGEGLVTIDRLTDTNLLTVTGALGAGVLLFSGLGWVDAARQGIRAMFDLPDEGNPFVQKAFDVLVLLVLGVGVVLSVVVTVLLTTVGARAVGWLGIDGPVVQEALRIAVDGALVVLDVGLFLLFFRLLARVARPWRELMGGAVIGALGLFALKVGGGLLLGLASGNRFLASVSIVVGLLIWLSLVARLTLLSAAWAAVSPAPVPVGPPEPADHRATGPMSARPAPTYGAAAADRVTLAAGVVLGGLLGGLGVALIGGLRSGVARFRHGARSAPGADRDPLPRE